MHGCNVCTELGIKKQCNINAIFALIILMLFIIEVFSINYEKIYEDSKLWFAQRYYGILMTIQSQVK
jgi:hypothetical protein